MVFDPSLAKVQTPYGQGLNVDPIPKYLQFLFWNIMNIFEQIAKLERKFQWISTDHLDSTINILYLFYHLLVYLSIPLS